MTKRNIVLGTVLGAGLIGLVGVGVASADVPGGCNFGHGYGHGDFRGASFDGHRHGHGHRDGMRGLLRKLDLTSAQRDQIFQIRYKQMPQLRDKMKALRENRRALRDAVTSATYDPQKVQSLASAEATARADLTVMRIQTFHQIYALLTPEQQAKVTVWKSERGHGSRDHRGWRMD